jgi:branched-chain amino acid transport system ATP-binding protein
MQKVDVRYDAVIALKQLSIVVKKGAVTSVLGRNGAGKSTLFKAIMGLVPISAGAISYDGVRLDQEPAWKRVSRRLALVPEGSGVISNISVYDNLRLGAYWRSLSRNQLRAEIDRCATIFPIISARLRSIAGNLSGGERQMVAIARAILADPEIILLDEPSFGLAPLVVEQVFLKLRDLASEGYGILVSEQNAAAALDISDLGYVLDRGVLAFEGPAADLKNSAAVESVLFA